MTMDDTQRANLKTLSNYLRSHTPPPEFDMDMYISGGGAVCELRPAECTPEVYRSCGTVACAVGHGPLAGIEAFVNETWQDYVDRAFDASQFSDKWIWMFGPGWADVDNTPTGAAARIDWYLEKGLPEDYWEQYAGRVPLCYTVNEPIDSGSPTV